MHQTQVDTSDAFYPTPNRENQPFRIDAEIFTECSLLGELKKGAIIFWGCCKGKWGMYLFGVKSWSVVKVFVRCIHCPVPYLLSYLTTFYVTYMQSHTMTQTYSYLTNGRRYTDSNRDRLINHFRTAPALYRLSYEDSWLPVFAR